MKKLSKLFISFLVVSCFLFGCGTNAASVDKQKAEEALALYQSYRDGEGDCQEIMAKITSVSRDIEDDELAELVSGIATLMPFENENGTESTDEQIAKIKEHIGISDTVENSNSETDDSPSEILSSDDGTSDEAVIDENSSTWKYYSDASNPEFLKACEMLTMKSYHSTYTNGFQFMNRDDFIDVEPSSLEDWFKILNDYPDNSFCEEVQRILNSTNYNNLSMDEKAFLDFYIRYDSFTDTRKEHLDCTLGRVIGDVYVINYDDHSYYTMDNGKDVTAPREMVFDMEGLNDWGLTQSKMGLVYFSDFNDASRHCVYDTVVLNEDWKADAENKYICARLDDGLVLSPEGVESAYNQLGYCYITNTAKAKTLCKYNGEDYNKIIDDYAELISFMKTFSDEVYLPYLIEIRAEAHQKWLDEKAEKEKWENMIPAVGMTKEEVLKTKWGAPDNKNITNFTWGTNEQWVYDYKGYVYFEDGIVTAVTQTK